jgi:hypothetical protein
LYRPFWRAQIFHTDKVYSCNKPILFNTTLDPVREITANTQHFMQCPGARDIGFTPANLTGNNGNNSGKVIIAMLAWLTLGCGAASELNRLFR